MGRHFPFPPLAARDPDEHHRAATQLELFFDLISVIAIAAVTAGLHHAISEGEGVEKLPAFAFLFTAIWWAWMNFTWFASAFDNDGPSYRVLVMTIMAGELIFASGAGETFETLDFSWGVAGWCIMRVAMALLWLRASANGEYRRTTLRYAAGILFAQGCWVAYYFSVTPGTPLFFALAILIFLIEFSVPPIAERARLTPFHRHHIIERYGLLTIISLGEIMLAISLGLGALYGEHAEAATALTAFSALIVVFAIFWIYFCEREHLPSRKFMTAFIWGYIHVFIFAGIAAFGAGVTAELDVTAQHSAVTQSVVSWWLGVPLAVVFLALWIARDRHFTLGSRSYTLPLAALAALILAAAGLPCWAFAVLSVLTLLWRVPLREPDAAR